MMTNITLNTKVSPFNFLEFGMMVVFLKSLNAWFTFQIPATICNIVGLVSILIYFAASSDTFYLTRRKIVAILVLIITMMIYSRGMNFYGFLDTLITILLISCIIIFPDFLKVKLFRSLTKVVAFITFFSLCAWILFLIGIRLPYSVITYKQYVFNNYIFFIHVPNSIAIFPRYSGIFLEPGYAGVMALFLVIANNFDYRRKEVLILIISIFLSFSLAAYILLFISIFLLVILNSRRRILYIFFGSLVMLGLYFSARAYNDGDNVVNLLIFKRLQITEDGISGNNRTYPYLDRYYGTFIESSKKFLGIGNSEYSKRGFDREPNAGYKVFLVKNGFVGLFILVIFYLLLLEHSRSSNVIILFIIYSLSFLQAAYSLWLYQLFIFITAIQYIYNDEDLKKA